MMQDIQLAMQIYFIGIVVATIMACLIRALQVILGRLDARKSAAVKE